MNLKLFLLLLLLPVGLSAQNTSWTLAQCIDYAYENNLQIQQNALNEENNKLTYYQSKSNLLPNLNGSFNYNINFAGATDPTTFEFVSQRISTNSLGLNSQMLLYNNGRLRNQIDAAWMEYKRTGIQNEVVKRDIALTISNAYLQILLAKEQLRIAQQQLLLTSEQKSNTEKLINAGMLPEGDILDLEAQFFRDEANIISAESVVTNALLNLKFLLDIPGNEAFDILSPTLPEPDPRLIENYNVDQIVAYALEQQPEIRSAEIGRKIAIKNIEIAEAGKYPSISLNGNISTSWSSARQQVDGFNIEGVREIGYLQDFTPVFEPVIIPVLKDVPYFRQLDDNLLQFVGVNMTVPIFNRNAVKTNIAQAKIGLKSAELSQSVAIQNLEQTIRQAYTDALVASKNYQASLKSVESFALAYEFAQKRYNLGVSNALEMLLAQNSLNTAKSQLESNKYQYWFNLKVLDFYLGKAFEI